MSIKPRTQLFILGFTVAALLVAIAFEARGHGFADRDDVNTIGLSRVYETQFRAAMSICNDGQILQSNPAAMNTLTRWYAGETSNAAFLAEMANDLPSFVPFAHCIIDVFHDSFDDEKNPPDRRAS